MAYQTRLRETNIEKFYKDSLGYDYFSGELPGPRPELPQGGDERFTTFDEEKLLKLNPREQEVLKWTFDKLATGDYSEPREMRYKTQTDQMQVRRGLRSHLLTNRLAGSTTTDSWFVRSTRAPTTPSCASIPTSGTSVDAIPISYVTFLTNSFAWPICSL